MHGVLAHSFTVPQFPQGKGKDFLHIVFCIKSCLNTVRNVGDI